jgi:hypothetical protein
MPAPKVRSDHDALKQIAQQFGQQADSTKQMEQNLKSRVETLRGRDWVGKAATKFYGEMGSSGGGSWFKGKGKGIEWGKEDGKGYRKPSFGIKYTLAKGAAYGDASAPDGFSAGGYEAGAEFSVEGLKKGKVGIFGEAYAAKLQGDTLLAGDKDFGLTAAGDVKALSVSAFAGVKDGSVGASIGGSLISAKGEIGTNVSGYNVGVNAEVGLKAELGLQIGKNTKIKLPFVTLGFSFGKARD